MELAYNVLEGPQKREVDELSKINSCRNNHIRVTRRPYFDLNCLLSEMKYLHFEKTQFEIWDYKDKVRGAFNGIKARPLSEVASHFVDQLEEDVISLISNSFNISHTHRPFEVSLNFIQNVPCTKYHADFLPLRLLCTYFGSGTVFLEEKGTRYACLNQGSANKRVMVKGTEPLESEPFELLLLKGRKFGGGELKPCAHRSPEIDGNKFRLLLKVDFK